MSTIWLVRHGETEWNRARRYQGRKDSALTPEGRLQALRIAALLAHELPRPRDLVLVSSPLGRAVATARIIGAALDLRVTTDARLAELTLGEWDGLDDAEIEAGYPGARDGATRWDWYFRAPGGESYEAAAARLGDWLASVTRPTVAVAHGLAGRILRGLYSGLERDASLQLHSPQDGVFRLDAGHIEYLATPRQ